MAVDARLGRGYPGVARLLHGHVAVLALQPQALNVMLVTERHRLVGALSLAGHPRGPLQLVQRHPQRDHQQTREHKTHTSQGIRAAVKYLSHASFLVKLVTFVWRARVALTTWPRCVHGHIASVQNLREALQHHRSENPEISI